MRNGNFAGLGVIKDPLTGQPFPNNAIPANRLNQTALRLLERFYPLPQGPSAGSLTPVNNFASANRSGRSERAYSIRVDQNFAPGHTVFARFSQAVFDVRSTDSGLPVAVRIGQPSNLVTTIAHVISDTYAFTPKLLNESRLGFVRFTNPRSAPLLGTEIVTLAGLTGFPAPLDPEATGLPTVTITGLRGISTQAETRYAESMERYRSSDLDSWGSLHEDGG
jgi:hypothetical protein